MDTAAITQPTPAPSASGTDGYVDKGGSYVPPTNASSPALIVTSGQSRSTYATNANNLNAAVSNIAPQTTDPSIVNYLNANKMPSDYNSRAAMAKQYGIEGYTGSASQNTQLLGMIQSGGKDTKDAGTGKDTTVATGASDGKSNNNSSPIDPAVKGQFDTAMAQLDSQVSDAKATLSSALSTLQNDPAAASAISMIEAKFDQQIQIMKDKNAVFLGSQVTNAARSGSLQYANRMESNFFSDEQGRASQNLSDLIVKETSAILSAQAAYKKGDVSAFNDASKNLDSLLKQKTDAINKLLDETDKAVKTQQAQQKIDAAAMKQQTTDNIRVSTSLGKSVASAIADNGITDPKKRAAYIAGVAQAHGITDPAILESAVIKAEQDQKAADLKTKNTNDIIANRDKTKAAKPAGKNTYANFTNKPSTADISKVNAYIQSIGGNQAAIDAANADETLFYKTLNAVPPKSKSS